MSKRPTIAYQPALDGVRAFAVAAVLLFHAGVPGFDGGYLGVSVFFTLSGFLITSLLLHEHEATGRVDLANFYSRRLRRLLPASIVCLVGVVLLAWLTDLFDGVADLRTHVVGAVTQVANWVFLAGEGSYQDLLARTSGTSSPLEHFWSLAIEEQFYWIWPPVMLLILRRASDRRGRIVAVGTITLATALAAPLIARIWGADAAYWATPARISEILIGAFLAVALAGRQVHRHAGIVAPAAVAVLAAAIVLFPSSGGPAYQGALPLVGVVSASLILGLQVPGPIRRAFGTAPMVWVGRVSYGLYLFHWPVFVLVHPDRVDLPEPLLFVVRIGITLAVTVASYELIEQPVRTNRRLRPSLTFVTAGAATAGLVAVAVSAVPAGLGEYWDADTDAAEAAAIEVTDAPLAAIGVDVEPQPVDALTGDPAEPPPGSTVPPTTIEAPVVAPLPATTDPVAPTVEAQVEPTLPVEELLPLPPLSRPVRIVVTGDSTAQAFGTGLVNWAASHPDLAQVEVVSAPGCGFLNGGERRTGDTIGPIEGCDGWVDTFVYPAVVQLQPDVVVAMVTSWDLIDRRWDTEELLSPLDADYARRLSVDYEQYATNLGNFGAAKVAFVRHPIPDVWWLPAVDAQEDPARHAVIYDLYDVLAASDERIDVVALDAYLTANGLDLSEEVRPDGIHPTPEAATDISEEFLGEQLIRVALGLPRT